MYTYVYVCICVCICMYCIYVCMEIYIYTCFINTNTKYINVQKYERGLPDPINNMTLMCINCPSIVPGPLWPCCACPPAACTRPPAAGRAAPRSPAVCCTAACCTARRSPRPTRPATRLVRPSPTPLDQRNAYFG